VLSSGAIAVRVPAGEGRFPHGADDPAPGLQLHGQEIEMGFFCRLDGGIEISENACRPGAVRRCSSRRWGRRALGVEIQVFDDFPEIGWR